MLSLYYAKDSFLFIFPDINRSEPCSISFFNKGMKELLQARMDIMGGISIKPQARRWPWPGTGIHPGKAGKRDSQG
jgi:hypothetical protein